jgi:serine/threonine protein kinase
MMTKQSIRGQSIRMNRYRILGRIGDGAYGSVVLAIKLDSGEKVAIKK